jgi:hypothetical protein
MKKLILSVAFAALSAVGANAQILQWNTWNLAGTEGTVNSVYNDPNVSAAALAVGPGVNPATNSNRLGGTAWFDTGDSNPTTLLESIAGGDYIQFTVTPNAGYMFSATNFSFIWDRSSTGPGNVTLRSSLDSFSSDLGTVTGITGGVFATNNIPLSLTNITTAVTFRIYGWGATNAAGSGGFDTNTNAVNVSLDGTVVAIPEPSTYALIIGGGLLLLGIIRRRSQLNA